MGPPAGTCQAHLKEIRGAGTTAPVAVVAIEFDVQWTRDVTEQNNADLVLDARYIRLDMTVSVAGCGDLLWDLTGGHVQQVRLEQRIRIVRDGQIVVNDSGIESIVESVEEMAGVQVLTVAVERKP